MRLQVYLFPLFLGVVCVTSGCSVAGKVPGRQGTGQQFDQDQNLLFSHEVFFSDLNPKFPVRYPQQASSVLNTVAGHFAQTRGSLPQASRYFEEVARLRANQPALFEPQLELTRADIALQLGDLATALSALAALEVVDSKQLTLQDRMLMAALLFEQSRYVDAARVYRDILGPPRNELELVNDEALSFLIMTQYRINAQFMPPGCSAGSSAESIDAVTNLVCGRIAEQLGQLEQALVYYRLAQERAPELRSMQLDEYRVLLKLNRGEQVISRLQIAFKANPSGDLRRLLSNPAAGDRSAESSNALNMSRLLQEISLLAPGKVDSADIRGKLAALKLRASQPMSALRELSLILAIDSESDSARYLRASLLASAGRRPEARADLLKINGNQQSFAQARLLLAQMSRLEGNVAQAQLDLWQYVEAFPNDKLGVLTYISLLKEQEKYEEALNLIAALEASSPTTHRFLGIERLHLLAKLGRGDEAITLADEVLVSTDDKAAVQNFLAYALATRAPVNEGGSDDLDRARELAERAVAEFPDEASYLDTLGWVMFKRGNLQRAVELLKRAAALSPSDFEIAEHLGDVLEAINPGSGATTYRNALESARDNERHSTSVEDRATRQRLEVKLNLAR